MNLIHSDPPAGSGFRRDLVRWRNLVAPAWLAALSAGQPTAAAPAGEWRLLEIGFGEQAAHACGHIPGATYIDTGELEVQPLWNKVSDEALLRVLLANGIRHDTTVILYGRSTLAAARAAHLMLYAGVRDVRLLDGGFAAWTGARLPLARASSPAFPAARDFGVDFPARADYMVDTQQAKDLLRRPDAALVSIRSWNEFVGITSGYSYIEARGEIPGARWGRAGDEGVHSMTDYHRADGTMRPAKDIRAMWQASGVHAGQHAAFYCGTGWRASLAFFYAWLMAWERISVYDGGWFEWSGDAANPIERRSGGPLSA